MDTNSIYCTACGSKNGAGARYCAKCGAPLQSGEVPSVASSSAGLITLSCPNCGGELEVTADMERFTCKYCGGEHIVKRSETAVSLAPVVEELKRVGTKFDQVLTGSDRLAAEQTIQRLKTEIPALEKQVAAKEAQMQAIVPRPFFYRLSMTLSQLGGFVFTIAILFYLFFKLDFFADLPAVDRFLKANVTVEKLILVLATAFACILIGTLLTRLARAPRVVRANPVRPNAYEKRMQQENAELEKLKADLQKRKQQLEQLNQYTAER